MRAKTLHQIAQEAAKYAVEDMQKIVDANEKLVNELKDYAKD